MTGYKPGFEIKQSYEVHKGAYYLLYFTHIGNSEVMNRFGSVFQIKSLWTIYLESRLPLGLPFGK